MAEGVVRADNYTPIGVFIAQIPTVIMEEISSNSYINQRLHHETAFLPTT